MKKIDLTDKIDAVQPPRVRVFDGTPNPSSFPSKPVRKRRRWLKITIWLVVAVIVGGIAFVAVRAANLSSKIFVGQTTTFVQKLHDLLRGSGGQSVLAGEEEGQINILLLGIGGEGHDGPYLSDTMILAQIRPDTAEVSLTAIPRDYLVTLPEKQGDQKINAAFALGFNRHKDWNEAGSWARQVVEHMSGLTIPYFAVIDFSGFEKAVNEIGGVSVHIDRTFTDYSYPDSGTGYLPPVTFKEGDEQMNGTRALQFARSRHAAGPEGSDFARSERQQKIINAFKTKVFSMNLLGDAGKLNNLLTIFANHFHTNLDPAKILHMYNLTKDKDMQILSASLDPETGLVCSEILASNGAYVLIPCKSEDDVKSFFENSFAAAKLKTEESVVWLASSTGNRKAYDTAYRKLTNAGLTVFELTYEKDDLPTTIIYQVNPKPATLEFITHTLNATEATLPPPGVKLPKDRVDTVVVLGMDAPVEAAPTPYVAPPARKATTTPEQTTPGAGTTTPSSSTSTPKTSSSTPPSSSNTGPILDQD